MTLEEFACAVGGWTEVAAEVTVVGAATDSRCVAPGQAFVAIRGERVDGHDYCTEALARGASCVVVSADVSVNGPVVRVADTVAALGSLARAVLAEWKPVVVAVTGSVGKTTVRTMAGLILNGRYLAAVAPHNYNSEVGVPLAVANADTEATHLVLEFAMRGEGQIRLLTEMTRPRVGAITNIGVSHIELLGSRDAIAAAKCEILEGMDPEGTACIPADDPYAGFLRKRARARVITFGRTPNADVRAEDVRHRAGGMGFRIATGGDQVDVRLEAVGDHYVADALCAAAMAVASDVPLSAVAAGLGVFRPEAHRGQILRTDAGVDIIDDCYNAAPDSMAAALAVLSATGIAGGRVAVLGDMLELGEHARALHEEVGRRAAAVPLDELVTVGERAAWIADGAESSGMAPDRVRRCATVAEACETVLALARPGDTVLVKASRGLALERLVEYLVTGGEESCRS
jgi:UDP-N-acetylmuramoyl-tripeptide--D-alanyl-D-alanine ligase